ncbi:hypothetical protein D3C85_974070 [compost metagenome]
MVGAFGQADALYADRVTRRVHHDEHVFEAAVFLPHQPAKRTFLVAEGQHRGGAGMDAELVFEGHTTNVIAFAEAAVVPDPVLRHHEQ